MSEELEMQRRRVDMATEFPPRALEYEHRRVEVGDKQTLLLYMSNKEAHYNPSPSRA